MKKPSKQNNLAFAVVFVILTAGFGFATFINLVRYYTGGQPAYTDWTVGLGSKTETDIGANFYGKTAFVSLNGLMRNILAQREMNDVIKLDNGHVMATEQPTSERTLEYYADRVKGLSDYLEKQGIPLLYVAPLCKTDSRRPLLPTGLYERANYNTDIFLGFLREYGVSVMDLRQWAADSGLGYYDLMYKTDHHWTTRTAFYAYCQIEGYIAEKLSCPVDERLLDIDNYTVTLYPSWHLGSAGQRTGVFFAGADDFETIFPSFETKILKGDTRGRVEDFADYTLLREKDYTQSQTYNRVYGPYLQDFVNLDCPNDVKLLVVTDSFGQSVNPFLISSFSQVRTIHNNDCRSLTREYIEEYRPDMVILLYFYGTLYEGSGNFEFGI